LSLPTIEDLCNCGYFDLPHLPTSLCNFYPTDKASFEELKKNLNEFFINLQIVEAKK
jgi:hypothetical protein